MRAALIHEAFSPSGERPNFNFYPGRFFSAEGSRPAIQTPAMIDTRYLKSFAVLAKYMHFRRAAAALGISQPALTQQIRALEETIGGPLINRTNRTMSLTPAGEVFLEDVRRILALMDRAERNAEDIFDGRIATLRLGVCSATAMSGIFAEVIREAQKRLPAIEVIAEEHSPAVLSRKLAAGELDCVIWITFGSEFPEGTVSLPVASCHAALIARRDRHLLSIVNGKIDAEKLAQEKFIFYAMADDPPDSPLALESTITFVPRKSIRLGSLELILTYVDEGYGAAVVPEFILPRIREQTESLPINNFLMEIKAFRLPSSNSPKVLKFFAMLSSLFPSS